MKIRFLKPVCKGITLLILNGKGINILTFHFLGRFYYFALNIFIKGCTIELNVHKRPYFMIEYKYINHMRLNRWNSKHGIINKYLK